MTEDLVRAGSQHVRDVQTINKELIEKTLRMRCLAYLHQIKSELLTQTIFSISASKKEVQRVTEDLRQRTDLLQRQQTIIAQQKGELEGRNRDLEQIRADLERKVSERTLELRKTNEALEGRVREALEIQQALRESEAHFREYAKIFQTTAEGLMITDVKGDILEVNPAFTRITGYEPDEALGKNARILQSGRHDKTFYKDLWRTLLKHGQWQGEVWNRRKNGQVYPQWLNITAVTEDGGSVSRYVGVFSDITSIKESEARLDHLAHHDTLTGLPNRLLFVARLEHALMRARRERRHVAVIFIDLDRFKTINDTLGHPAGDRLLQLAGERLQECVRAEDTVARLGGDEFILILEQVPHYEGAGHVAQKLLDAFRRPFALAEGEVFVSGSIGISLYPEDGDDATALVRNADVAMYRAKEHGRNNYQFYTEEMTSHAFERLTLEINLRKAVDQGELELVYQPQYCLSTGRLVGLEALLRWHHRDLGAVPPGQFIPVAEETGLIGPIGDWVVQRACKDILTWRQAGLEPPRVAVNLSCRQLDLGDIGKSVGGSLEQHGLEGGCLELELTETGLMRRPEHHARTLDALKRLGLGLAIDDFGTGYSSLAYLKRFPVDRLKIDQGFVRAVPDDANDAAIVQAIVALAHSLELEVVAEGVEREEQRAFLVQTGCDHAQGWLLGHPVAAQECRALFATKAAS